MADDARGFRAATGAEHLPEAGTGEREAAVRAALDGLRQIRRVMNTGAADPLAVPADWERLQPVRAVALVLEAAGIPPSAVDAQGRRVATGYRVTAAERPPVVRVEWLGPAGSGAVHQQQDALRRCAEALGAMGWPALRYRGPRRQWFLEAEPRR
ncbi:hypothetical protein [Streptomyces sp. NPDC018031]|uniref:hypothetical protein n=1 Tax=Streptomyces sp. NPDC018031 TaxID=3365033 RepID=UPI0037AF80DA